MHADARWSGSVDLGGDVTVPAGRRLVVAAGTDVGCSRPPVESGTLARFSFTGLDGGSRLSRSAAVIVEGELSVEGSREAPARFGGEFWGGLLAVRRGRIVLRGAVLAAADRAFCALDLSRAALTDCELSGGIAGAALGGNSRARFRRCRFESTTGIGLLAADDAEALASLCSFQFAATGAAAADFSRLRWRGCDARGCAAGLRSSGAARARARRCRFDDCGVGATAQGRSELELDSCAASGGIAGWEALDDSRLWVRSCAADGSDSGLWAQNRARAVCDGSRFERGRFGLRASQNSRLTARRTETAGQANGGALVEDSAFGSFQDCPGVSAQGGPIRLGEARADLDGVALER